MKALELYHRSDNPLYLPETGCPNCARFFFTGLGMNTIGFSAATDVTSPSLLGAQAGIQAAQAGNPGAWEEYKPVDEFLTSWGMNFRLIGPMQREIARLNFEGKLQAVAEEQGKETEILPFGTWNAEVTFGAFRRGAAPPAENPKPAGRILVAQLADNQFLVTGYNCRIDFRPAGTEQQRKSQPVVLGTDETPSALIDGRLAAPAVPPPGAGNLGGRRLQARSHHGRTRGRDKRPLLWRDARRVARLAHHVLEAAPADKRSSSSMAQCRPPGKPAQLGDQRLMVGATGLEPVTSCV